MLKFHDLQLVNDRYDYFAVVIIAHNSEQSALNRAPALWLGLLPKACFAFLQEKKISGTEVRRTLDEITDQAYKNNIWSFSQYGRCLNIGMLKHWQPSFERALPTNMYDFTLPTKEAALLVLY